MLTPACRSCNSSKNARNRHRAKVGLPPSLEDWIEVPARRRAGFRPGLGATLTAPNPSLSLSPSRENPDPFDSPPGPVSVWQCPGCGFVIGIDECCDCR